MEVAKLFTRMLFGTETGLAAKVQQSKDPGRIARLDKDSDCKFIPGVKINPLPSYAGSIAQVYVGSRGPEQLSIKVIRTSAQRILTADTRALESLSMFSAIVNKAFPQTVQRVTQNLLEEMSLARELSMALALAPAMKECGICSPSFFPEWSDERHLVYKFIEARPLHLVESLPEFVPTAIASIFMIALHKFRLCISDITPGNFLFNELTGKITMIDFGAVRRIPPDIAALNQAIHSSQGEKASLSKLFPDDNAFVELCCTNSRFYWSDDPVQVNFGVADAGMEIMKFEVPPGFEPVAQGGVRLLQTLTFLKIPLTIKETCTDILKYYDSTNKENLDN